MVKENKYDAVLSTLSHHTDLAATVAGAVTVSRLVIASGARVLLGYSIAETASAAAKIRLRDGINAAAPLLAVLTFTALGNVNEFFPDEGIEVTSGAIFLEIVSTGSVEGCLYWG